ncbi:MULTISPECIES: DUF2207 domain-containing protein [unclassified Rhizobium]|uniref:DUF2207 domain-containing protein n=1 Tax=unclassified Rhizobium TaxID=2613769 RepID=UPI0007138206|nr:MULTISPECIES: DUF2207 domain-containing protein [unclassified Rhizobium]KQS96235.1 hypothetical protein ASG50_03995 [Rhizobium sp. Leaf386]KQT06074.1 hypothetical protein ASG42_00240 [Rhizobium sp. Leaf391]KQU09690.1 hypothetical protein ASG68_01380 [Rhizobium sp. Leaf453]
MKRLATILGFLHLFLLLAVTARAEEVIKTYQSAIMMAKNGLLTVSETITANVEGNQIKRGIYRDFPMTFVDDSGRTVRVDFNLVSVERDGVSEPYHTESIDGGIRIYTGDKDVFLPDGEHTFRITYETGRQIRYFDDHDELYWNVTGNGWVFPIEQASATVTLPPGVKAEEMAVFTGGQGSKEKNARFTEMGSQLVFLTTSPLGAYEGLTIAVKMPKGSIDPPSVSQQRSWWLQDNLPPILAITGFAVAALYYSRMWLKVGRDPARGVVVPRWDAPDGISPALVNYIDNKGFSGEGWTALSAAALNLAVQGYVVLEDLKNSLVITRTAKTQPTSLPTGEAALLSAVQSRGGKLTINRENGPTVQRVGMDFRGAMEKEHRNKYYHANTAYVVGGIALSALFVVAVFVAGILNESTVLLVLLPVLASVFISLLSVSLAKLLRRRGSLFARIGAIIVVTFFGFFLIAAALSALAAVISTALSSHQVPLLLGIGGIVLVNILFFYLMGAPTPLGSKMMDGIDGLRQYLTLAEKERMNMAGAPEMSPQHFEKLLPYAVALGVEKPWADTFDRWLLAAAAGAAAAAAYQPSWYSGQAFHSGSFGDHMGGFAGSMANTMTSSLPPPPKSSSSGFSSGGGFSGGGGGGGGGGGW